MSDLYLSDNPFKSTNVESDVAASGTIKSTVAVDASVNASKTLGLEESRVDKNLGKIDVNPTVDDTAVDDT
ncbi:hypothetical protein A2U01_0095236, partial [Trifolium medium]|nr:hypothetical protein [Trifolium medium]